MSQSTSAIQPPGLPRTSGRTRLAGSTPGGPGERCAGSRGTLYPASGGVYDMKHFWRSLLVVLSSLLLVSAVAAAPRDPQNFVAHLTGAAERPIPRETPATGQVV